MCKINFPGKRIIKGNIRHLNFQYAFVLENERFKLFPVTQREGVL